MSLAAFCKLRPKYVLTQKHQKLFQCLCEYCENVKLKLTSLNKLVEQSGRLDLKINDIYEAVDETMCKKEKEERYHKLSCIDRKCDQCGTNLLKEKLEPISNDEVSVVKWNAWVSVVKWNAWSVSCQMECMGCRKICEPKDRKRNN